MFLINAVNFVGANWKAFLIGGACVVCFASGWYIKGNIEEARNNAKIIEAIETTKKEEFDKYEKARKVEEKKRKIREAARNNTIKIYQSAGDSVCADRLIPADWLQLINEAIGNTTSQP